MSSVQTSHCGSTEAQVTAACPSRLSLRPVIGLELGSHPKPTQSNVKGVLVTLTDAAGGLG